MFDGGIYYIEGNYEEIHAAFKFAAMLAAKGSGRHQMEIDYSRTPCFISKPEDKQELRKQWETAKTEEYNQGDFVGSHIAASVMAAAICNDQVVEYEETEEGTQLPVTLTDKCARNDHYKKSNISHAYLDDQNHASGISFSFTTESDNTKQFWIISVLHNVTGTNKEKRISVFMHFPKGWSANYCDQEACAKLRPRKILSENEFNKTRFPFLQTSFKKKLEKVLNSKTLNTFLNGVLNPNGTMKPAFFDKVNLERRGYKIEGNTITSPPVGMLDGDIYYTRGTYQEISEAFKYNPYDKPAGDQKDLTPKIQGDTERLSSLAQDKNEAEALKKAWISAQAGTLKTYDQADMTGSPIANQIFGSLLEKFGDPILPARKNERFGYFDDKRQPSGFTVVFGEINKQPYWILSIIENPLAPPTERIVHVFTNFPKGMSENTYNAEKLSALKPVKVTNKNFLKPSDAVPFKETLKKALNSEKTYLLLENMLNSNGTIKPDFFDEANLEQRGYKTEDMVTTHPPVPKKSENTVTPTTTPIHAKTNANVTAFIQEPQIASEINRAVASRNFVLSEDRHFFVNKKDGRQIHIGLQGQMTTDPIHTAKTPNPSQAALDVLIVALRTLSVIYREGGKDNFPAEKFALKLTQREGANEKQKADFLRFEAKIREGLADEINGENSDSYVKEFLEKITFNGMKLDANLKKRQTPDDKGKEEADETEEQAAKRLRMGGK